MSAAAHEPPSLNNEADGKMLAIYAPSQIAKYI